MTVSSGAAAHSGMFFWLDRLLGIISRFDNSADAVRGAARRVDEGKAVGSLHDRRFAVFEHQPIKDQFVNGRQLNCVGFLTPRFVLSEC